jgi:predicted alpha/beta superfamily hydrolase
MPVSKPIPFVNPAIESMSLHSEINGRRYDMRIGLPASYSQGDARYPVFVVLDAEFAFGTAFETAMMEALWSKRAMAPTGTKVVPEAIVVGISFPDTADDPFRRNYEFMPAVDIDDLPAAQSQFLKETSARFGHQVRFGGSDAFLEVMRGEILPAIDAAYRTNPSRRMLFGESAGGTFACYALLTKPGTFTDYIIVSPGSLGGDTFSREQMVASTHGDLKARVYLTAGEAEAEDATEIFSFTARFAEVLRQRRYPSLTLHTWFIPGASHVQTAAPSIARALVELWGAD